MTDHYLDDVKIIKASYELKIKAGSGGFSPEAIAAAEKRMAEAKEMFPSVATRDLEEIEEILRLLESDQASKELLLRIYSACTELKLNSQMFQYPLVTFVCDSLCKFCEAAPEMGSLTVDIIKVHLNTLRIAIGEGPRAITEKDHAELLGGLSKATAKAMSNPKSHE